MTFRVAISGLKAASGDLDVIGNNIANSNTTGFKKSRAEFADVFAITGLGAASNTPGTGVRLASISQQFTQGNRPHRAEYRRDPRLLHRCAGL